MQTASRRSTDRDTVHYETGSIEKTKKTNYSSDSHSGRSGGKYARREEKKKQSHNIPRIVWRVVWVVFLICCASYTLNPDNNILGIHGMRKAYASAQEVVQSELISPNSAVFPTFEPEFVTQKTKKVTYEGVEYKVYTVTAYVDSHNAFGTLVRNSFEVEIGFSTGGDDDAYYYNIVSLGNNYGG